MKSDLFLAGYMYKAANESGFIRAGTSTIQGAGDAHEIEPKGGDPFAARNTGNAIGRGASGTLKLAYAGGKKASNFVNEPSKVPPAPGTQTGKMSLAPSVPAPSPITQQTVPPPPAKAAPPPVEARPPAPAAVTQLPPPQYASPGSRSAQVSNQNNPIVVRPT